MHILETNSMEFITFWSLISCNILYITILLQGGMINNSKIAFKITWIHDDIMALKFDFAKNYS